MTKSLSIFEHKKGFFISTESLVLILLIGIIFLIGYLNTTPYFDFGNLIIYFTIILILYFVGYVISNFVLLQHKNGEFKGKLELEINSIIINETKYELNEISKISIRSSDFEGQFLPNQFAIARCSSNGLNNELILKLIDGKEIKCHFLQTKGQRIKNFKDHLTDYHLKGKMSWLQLLEILEIEDYNEIQIFKKELTERK